MTLFGFDWKSIATAGALRGLATPAYQWSEVIRSQQNIALAQGKPPPPIPKIAKHIGLKNTFFCGIGEQTAKAVGREWCYRGLLFAASSRTDLGIGTYPQILLVSSSIAIGDTMFNGGFDYITESRAKALYANRPFSVFTSGFFSGLRGGIQKTAPISCGHSLLYWGTCLSTVQFSKEHPITSGPLQTVADTTFAAVATTLVVNGPENIRKQMTGAGANKYNGAIDAIVKSVRTQGPKKVLFTGIGLYGAQNLFTAFFTQLVIKNNDIER